MNKNDLWMEGELGGKNEKEDLEVKIPFLHSTILLYVLILFKYCRTVYRQLSNTRDTYDGLNHVNNLVSIELENKHNFAYNVLFTLF